MRTIRDQIIESRSSGKPMKADFHDQNTIHFYTWIQQPDDVVAQSIINLRKMYVEEHNEILE